MNCDRKSLLLYAVTDRAWLGPRRLADDVEAAIRGGATMVQLREKDMPFDDFLAQAQEIKEICKKHGIPFIINDSVEVALSCGADGVHVGQSDLDALSVRERLGDAAIIGVSAQTVEQARLAQSSGADYLGVGAVFSTGTKTDADDVSFDTLKAICEAVSIPVVAIGGISQKNIEQLTGSGIAGVAVVSAIFAAEQIEEATRKLRDAAERCFAVKE